MSPEATLIAVNLVFLGFAYVWAYPRLSAPNAFSIMWRDAVISAAALMVGALFYAGKGIWFDLKVVEVNWLIYQFVILAVIETPLFIWYAWRNNLDFD